MLEKGLVQIYKGKTTAAFGLALRAAGQGNRVLIYQFLKPPALNVGERLALQSAKVQIHVEALEQDWNMGKSFDDPQQVTRTQAAIRDALKQLGQAARKRFYDVLILDEVVFCVAKGLADLAEVRDLIERRDPAVEIVLTGRGATPELLRLADLVTEMKPIKHPFEQGIPARRGIEF